MLLVGLWFLLWDFSQGQPVVLDSPVGKAANEALDAPSYTPLENAPLLGEGTSPSLTYDAEEEGPLRQFVLRDVHSGRRILDQTLVIGELTLVKGTNKPELLSQEIRPNDAGIYSLPDRLKHTLLFIGEARASMVRIHSKHLIIRDGSISHATKSDRNLATNELLPEEVRLALVGKESQLRVVTFTRSGNVAVLSAELFGQLKVKALTSDSLPLPNLEVYLLHESDGTKASMETAEDGIAFFRRLKSGAYSVQSEHETHWQAQAFKAEIREGKVLTMTLQLEAGPAFSGLVVDAQGIAVRGASVLPMREEGVPVLDGELFRDSFRNTETNHEGRFRIPYAREKAFASTQDLPDGFHLWVSGGNAGYAKYFPDHQDGEHRIVLQPWDLTTLGVQVVDKQGTPIQGASVRFQQHPQFSFIRGKQVEPKGSAKIDREVESDSQGMALLSYAWGYASVSVHHPSYDFQTSSVNGRLIYPNEDPTKVERIVGETAGALVVAMPDWIEGDLVLF
ncbi:MAG: carboxypeptidase regulatory-like domain-containing protein, partial [Planctomycetes bacterium]|nr:carboxypeptidase regulatory-like domain-containing protein [Planctomycetota bacterium]